MTIELLTYSELATLRLADLAREYDGELPPVVVLGDWQFMGHTWVGEGMGPFTDFLCLANRPDELGAVTLALGDLPRQFQDNVLKRLGLPLRKGMEREEIEQVLGAPLEVARFVEDRVSLDFQVGREFPYRVGCTVLADGGLIYLTMIREDILVAAAAAHP